MIRDGLAMEKGTASVQEEMKEVEQELEEKEALRRGEDMRNLEEGGSSSHRGMSSAFKRTMSSPNLSDDDDDHHSFKPRRKAHKKAAAGAMSVLEGVQNLAALVLSPAWVQTFVMTFLGEWGDRSQIATIAMAAGQDYWWVTVGSICGHSVCTAGAVIGGRFLAEKISVRNGKLYYPMWMRIKILTICYSYPWRRNGVPGVWRAVFPRGDVHVNDNTT